MNASSQSVGRRGSREYSAGSLSPLVRTWPENGEPDHGVVADGRWLVFDVSLSVLDTLADEEFSGEFEPAAHQAVP